MAALCLSVLRAKVTRLVKSFWGFVHLLVYPVHSGVKITIRRYKQVPFQFERRYKLMDNRNSKKSSNQSGKNTTSNASNASNTTNNTNTTNAKTSNTKNAAKSAAKNAKNSK